MNNNNNNRDMCDDEGNFVRDYDETRAERNERQTVRLQSRAELHRQNLAWLRAKDAADEAKNQADAAYYKQEAE